MSLTIPLIITVQYNTSNSVGNQSMSSLLQPEPWMFNGINNKRYKGIYLIYSYLLFIFLPIY